MKTLLWASFSEAGPAQQALRVLREKSYTCELFSPYPLHDIERPRSAIRRYTFFGALFGAGGGFALAAYAATAYLLPTGGRAIIAMPPFLLISYELTILFGVVATLLGFFWLARLPAWKERAYRPQASCDRIVLAVELTAGDEALVAALLKPYGIEQWESSSEEEAS